MALVLKDRVKETATAPGTGTITLGGAASGFQSFSAVGNGNTTYFAIVDSGSGAWEVNYGTYTASGTTLTRNAAPLSSSAGGALVNFTGAVDVFCTYPSSRSAYQNEAGTQVVQQSFGAITATSAALTTGTVSTTPAANTDIANKSYVDGLVTQGISYHEPVFVESPSTAGNLNALYNQPGGAGDGVGATLTNNGTKAALTIDGVLMTTTKRVLIYNQTNAFENGVYTVTTVGTPDPGGTNWVLTRATDADTYGLRDPNALGYNDAFFVTNGDTGAGETYVCTTSGVITFGSTAITFAQISSAQVYNAGTGLTLSPATTFNIANTTVSANTYGSASAVPVFAVNAQGQLTSVTNTNIAINGSAVTGAISGQAGSVANALTLGTYLTGTSYNGSAAVTATVDATSANTASKVVARDSSGDFSAGTITATLSGAATSSTTATNLAGGAANQIPYQTAAGTTSFATAASGTNTVLNFNGSAFTWVNGTISGVALGSNLNALTLGTYLTGTSYNGSSTVTAAVDATSANTASKVVARDASGNFSAGTITAALSGNASTATSATTATTATNVSGGTASVTTLDASGAVTLSGGTANGVTYLNGSKVLTSGSALTFDSSDRLIVGAGSAVIGNRIEVVSNASSQAIGIRGRASDGGGVISWHPNGAATEYARIQSDNTSVLIFGTGASATEGMRLTSTGLGIGTSSPSSWTKLEVQGTAGAQTDAKQQIVVGAPTTTAGQGAGIRINAASGAKEAIGVIGVVNNASGNLGSMTFHVYNGGATVPEYMRLDNSGNLGIGTTSPSTKLTVYDTTSPQVTFNNGTSTFIVGNNAGGNNKILYGTGAYPMIFYTDATERVRISAAGGFSVGTTADPGAGAIYATGNITAYYSDKRLKTVSGKIENALDKVAQLSGVYYTNNSVAKSFGYDSDEVQVGVLAQDVEAVLPQIVKAAPFDLDEHGNSKSGENYKTVQYEKLVPLLIEAINELQAKVAALEAKG